MIRRFWNWLTSKCQTCSRIRLGLGVAVVALFAAGILMAGGAAGLAWTNTEDFCTSCHEMRDNVYKEFKGTIHDVNRSGVRAVCSNCHVPHEPIPMLKRKVRASLEIWGHLTGSIDTKEKFEKKRYELATRVWTRMKQTDSLECRNCHHDNAMDPEKQSEKARARHLKMKSEGMTCIDCHFGIAHHEPDGPGPQELKVERDK
jgi:cytochrome c-type protein NapC